LLLTRQLSDFFFDLFGGKTMILLFAAGDASDAFNVYTIAKSLTIPGWGVIITLLIQSVYMIAVGIERWLTYNKAKQQSRQYAPKVAQASRMAISMKPSISATNTKIRTLRWSFLQA
jgi:hypothetical protein